MILRVQIYPIPTDPIPWIYRRETNGQFNFVSITINGETKAHVSGLQIIPDQCII
jgi:hypothetical protein